MTEFVVNLEGQYQRPVTKISGMTALIDMGALIPVVSMSEPDLKEIFRAELVREGAEISGFGGKCKGKIYKLDKLIFGKLTFPGLHVFVPDEPVNKFDIIISATMFHKLSHEINYATHCMTVRIPDKEQCVRNLCIYDSNGQIHLLVNGEILSVGNVTFVSH